MTKQDIEKARKHANDLWRIGAQSEYGEELQHKAMDLLRRANELSNETN